MEGDTTLNTASSETLKKNLEKWHFFIRQLNEAVSPAHFPLTNPGVIQKIIDTQGMNLAEGFQRLQKDLAENNASFLNIPLTDKTAFSVGDQVAATPGHVIFQNDLIQLIHYQPTTQKIYQRPVLFIPPWINKYYILDLQPENSMVRWLIDQGICVFMISWVNPDRHYREKTFGDYLKEGPLAAIEAITALTGIKDINIAGYCIGGTLLACLLATLSKNACHATLHSATFFTTMLDFSSPGDLGLFLDEPQLMLLEQNMASKGYMDGAILAAIFSMLRAGDLIWPVWVKHYLKNEPLSASPFLYWNADSTHIPEQVHKFYLRNMYQHNRLATPSLLEIDGIPVDLSNITQPCWFVATERDHIAPWQACYQSSQLIKSPREFVLAGAGHVAGIINPPARNRYGYRLSGEKFDTAESFANQATFNEGSWWPAWCSWLKKHSGKQVSVNSKKSKSIPSLDAAPGNYVKVTLTDIAKKETES